MPSLEILYEDNHLIAVVKPTGLLVQGDRSGEPCLLDVVRAYLKRKYAKPGEVFLGLLHRLDKPVSGVILLAKTSKGASRLSGQFRSRTIGKTYHALVEGHPDPIMGTLVHNLAGKRAELRYRVLKKGPKHSLVEVRLKTGRKHQIRTQFASMGHALAGDTKYGGCVPFLAGAIGLVAYSLEFSHPVRSEERIKIVLPKSLEQEWAPWL